MPVLNWSTTPADNDDADIASGIALAEGQAPGQLNDSIRALMAAIKGDFAKSHTVNGYQKFPNGLILQWGSTFNASASDYAVGFPVAFPTACLGVVANPTSIPATTSLYALNCEGAATTFFNVRCRVVTTGGTVATVNNLVLNWIAVGF